MENVINPAGTDAGEGTHPCDVNAIDTVMPLVDTEPADFDAHPAANAIATIAAETAYARFDIKSLSA
jgi:hypothetical protein